MRIGRRRPWIIAVAIGCSSASCKKASTGASESETPEAAASDPTMEEDATAPTEGEEQGQGESDASAPVGEECSEEHAAMGHCQRDDTGGTPPP